MRPRVTGRATSTGAALGGGVTQRLPIGRNGLRIPVRSTSRLLRAVAIVLGALVPSLAHAQSAELRQATATRAELETLANSLSGAEADAIRQRLRDGDFQVGDRVIVTIARPDSTSTDTLTVREGREIGIPPLFATSLQGVLRSELQSHLQREVTRIIRDPRVEARTLVRVSMLGEVARPGYYWMTADALVSDAIMTAGGPTSVADPSKSVIRRGTEELWDRADVAEALRAGLTLDQLRVRAGDEIVVGKKSSRASESNLRVITTVVSLVVSVAGIVALSSR